VIGWRCTSGLSVDAGAGRTSASDQQRPLFGELMYMVRRGQYRFRTPLDGRYRQYPLPSDADVRCPKCRSRCRFCVATHARFVKDEQAGVCRLLPLPIVGSLPGKGSCIRCGSSFSVVQWPGDAYFSVDVHGGTVWAWNTTFLPALRARVAGDRVLERQLALSNGYLHYFLARIPKHAVVKRNRARLLRTLDHWLCRSKFVSSRGDCV
jgi:hypothetical protein